MSNQDGQREKGEGVTGIDLQALAELERKVLWLATWTIHHANHLRENADGLKVGGHQASSASVAAVPVMPDSLA